MKVQNNKAVTMIELLVVMAILAILSTIAAGVYSNEVIKSRYAKARAEIRTLEIAITQYEVDTGQFPPSGSGATVSPNSLNTTGIAQGSGYLRVALMSSMNNNPDEPLSRRWKGPYLDWDYNQFGVFDGRRLTELEGTTVQPGQISFLDPFGMPYIYINSKDYETRGGTRIPANMPSLSTNPYFNPSTFQIISMGADNETGSAPNRGLDPDDVSNFFSPEN
ncbi:MAG: prepilin-type N-terminal cleavage/methylation domain-containing protein [Candidatus Sumerlaeia bacterium]|nr:prepilin-type N-terminal cleavage/methylation domain-containing protein [Candidatus Sumerlaeia bacterium]